MELQDRDILAVELERRRICEPLRFFRPNGAQERFIAALADPAVKIIVFPAGNWVGKTTGAIAALGAMMWPSQAEHQVFSLPLFKTYGNTGYARRARIVSTPKELEDIGSIQAEIKRWWPRGRYTSGKNKKSFLSEFHTDTGWVVDLMSYEQAVDDFEGANIGVFIFNEPPPEDIFDACMARRKFGGKVMMPMTPLMSAAWIFDRLVAHDGENGIKVIYGSTEENCVIHGKNGVIPHEAIEDLKRMCDPDEMEARLNGKFLALAGNIFKTFDRRVHVAKEKIIPLPPSDCIEHIQSVDPATGKPLFCLWAYVDPSGFLYVYDEWPHFDFATAKESSYVIGDYVKIFRGAEQCTIHTRILDRHFGNNRSWSGQTLKQDFAKLGLYFIDSYSCEEEVETGILKVKEYLAYNRAAPLSNLNRPALLISPTCTNLIKSMERWGRNPKTGKPLDDCYKDPVDCVRYICAYRPLPASIAAAQGLHPNFNRATAAASRNWDTSRPFD